MAGGAGMRFFNNSSSSNRPADNGNAPLFERMTGIEENQQCKQKVEELNIRVHDLERINVDLEHRLEEQAKSTMETEKECVEIERKWEKKNQEIEEEVAKWQARFKNQETKTDRLREHLSRTEKELYSILQRKYELMRGPGRGGPAGAGGGPGGGIGGRGGGDLRRPNNADIYKIGDRSSSNYNSNNNSLFKEDADVSSQSWKHPQHVRQREMVASLNDFLGLKR